MSIGKNIKILRTKYGLTQQDLAEIAGVTNKAVSAWESNTKEPRMGAIEKIAKHFGLKKSNLIDENGMYFDQLNASNETTEITFVKPLYGSIAAGTPIEMLTVEDYIEVPKNIALKYPKAFLLKINGDSMNKVIPNNSYALINPQEEVNNGDVVAVAINGYDATLKRFYKLQNTTVLEPDSYNSEHVAKTFNGLENEPKLRVIGKMVWFMSGFDEILGGEGLKVAGYIRVSTEEQAKEGYSLDAQKERLINFCKSQDGWELIDIYPEEGKSAKDLNRPELQRLLKDAQDKKFDVILVYRLDRLTRSVSDLYELLKTFESSSIMFKSATEVYDTTTAMGKLFITIVAALAQWERENLSERVRFGMEELVREGNWHGGPVPFGYEKIDKSLQIIDSEAKTLRELRNIYMSGEGLGSTAKKLNALSLLKRGNTWSAQSVWYALDNPIYAGKIRYGEKKKNGKYASRKKEERVDVIWADTNFPTIFTWEEYEEHKDRMKRKEFYGHSKKREYRFTGILRCARCGATLIGRPYRNKKKDGTYGEPYYNYICSNRSLSKGCDLPLLRQELAESLIMDYLQNLNFDSREVPQNKSKEPDVEDEIIRLEKELKIISERRKKWQFMYVEDLISGEDLRERKREEDEKELIIQEQLKTLQASNSNNQKETIKRVFELLDVWSVMDDIEKKELMQIVFKQIVIECKVKNGKSASAKGKYLPFYIKSLEFN